MATAVDWSLKVVFSEESGQTDASSQTKVCDSIPGSASDRHSGHCHFPIDLRHASGVTPRRWRNARTKLTGELKPVCPLMS